jgi:hypothetical protein
MTMRRRGRLGAAAAYAALFVLLALPCAAQAGRIRIVLERGPSYSFMRRLGPALAEMRPHLAAWIEYPSGEFIKTAYVSLKGGKQDFWIGRRPHPLPVWEKRHAAERLADGVTGASPAAAAPEPLEWRAAIPREASARGFVVWLEANLGFDFNDSYPEGGKDVWGQPSLLLCAAVPANATSGAAYALRPVGRSVGSRGAWTAGTDGLTSALSILRSALVAAE